MSTSREKGQYLVDTEAKNSFWQSTASSNQIEALQTRCTSLERKHATLESDIQRVKEANRKEIDNLKKTIESLTKGQELTFQYIRLHDLAWYNKNILAPDQPPEDTYLNRVKKGFS